MLIPQILDPRVSAVWPSPVKHTKCYGVHCFWCSCKIAIDIWVGYPFMIKLWNQLLEAWKISDRNYPWNFWELVSVPSSIVITSFHRKLLLSILWAVAYVLHTIYITDNMLWCVSLWYLDIFWRICQCILRGSPMCIYGDACNIHMLERRPLEHQGWGCILNKQLMNKCSFNSFKSTLA